MKLYVNSPSGEKIYLNLQAETREELQSIVGYSYFTALEHTYNINEVIAEKESYTPAGTIVGGLIGIFGGPLGIAIGATIGTILGASSEQQEEIKVDKFNQS